MSTNWFLFGMFIAAMDIVFCVNNLVNYWRAEGEGRPLLALGFLCAGAFSGLVGLWIFFDATGRYFHIGW